MITSPQVTSTIDPTEGLVQYVQAVKPYHTKILEVLVEYVYTDAINVTVLDKMLWSDAFINGIVTQVRPLPTAITSPINIVTFGAVNGGSLYTNGVYNNVLLTGGTGTGAKANITVTGGGIIATTNTLVGGTLYINGTYYNVPLTGGTGTSAYATIVVSGGSVISVILTTDGIGYTIGDILSATPVTGVFSTTGNGSGFTITVATTKGGAVTFVEMVSSGRGYTVGDILTTNLTSGVASLGTIFGGSLYSAGIYYNVPLTGGTGTGAYATITISNVTAGLFVVGTSYKIISVGTTDFTLIGALSNTVGVVFIATGPGTGTGTAGGEVNLVTITTPGSGYTVGDILSFSNTFVGGTGSGAVVPVLGFTVTVQSSDLHAATTITESLLFNFSLDFHDDISASAVDIRPVGYGMDPYSTPGGSFGSPVDLDGLSITVVGSGGASFIGSISGTTLTVTTIAGVLTAGQTILGIGVAPNTIILNQLTGTIDGIGTYTVSVPQAVGLEAMTTDIGTFTLPVGGLDLEPFDE